MFQALFVAHAVIAGLIVLGATGDAARIGWLWRQPTLGRMRRAARGLRRSAVGLAVLLVAAFGVGNSMLKYHWSFAQTWLITALLLLVAAAGGIASSTVPRLGALIAAAAEESGAPADQPDADSASPGWDAAPSERLRAQAAAPALVTPLRAGALWIWAVLYLMLERPGATQSVLVGVLALAVGALLRVPQRMAVARIAAPPAERPGRGRLARASVVPLALLLAAVGWAGWSWQDSRLPGRISMAMPTDGGGGPGNMENMAGMPGMAAGGGMVSVATLTGPTGTSDASFTLTARDQRVRLASGATVSAVTFNGRAPGPLLTVHQGDLVQVTLVNDSSLPTSLHWHGLSVPNAEDGVPGVTQDAVRPGSRLVYRFRADQAGTYWYHSHEQSSVQVRRGLFGALVVLPKPAAAGAGDHTASQTGGQTASQPVDQVVTAHTWDTDHGSRLALDLNDGQANRIVQPGSRVRLRLLNADNNVAAFTLAGTEFQVAAIDGYDIAGPTPLSNARVLVPAGGRYDLTFTMPTRPVSLVALDGHGVGVGFQPPGGGAAPAVQVGADFQLDRYGSAGAADPAGVGAGGHVNRDHTIALDQRPGFHDGHFDTHLFMINGRLDPDMAPFMVTRGDLVRLTFVNRTMVDHPFHLHGHRLTVISHDGRPRSGSPVTLDTLNLEPGSTWVVEFRADNPGLWMFHCHNLSHAAAGMMAMFDYTGYGTPYLAGRDTGNIAE